MLTTDASVPPARSGASAGSHQPANSRSDTLRPPQPAAPSNRQHQQAPHSTVCSRGATQPCSSTEAQLQRCRTGSAWERVCGFCAACLCSVITAVHAFIVTQNVRGERTRQPFISKALHLCGANFLYWTVISVDAWTGSELRYAYDLTKVSHALSATFCWVGGSASPLARGGVALSEG